MASILKEVFSNRNILAIGSTNMLFQVFNALWETWWSLYLLEVLNTPIEIVGLLATLQSTSQILFQLPGGIVADRIGRKKVIIVGTAIRTIAPAIMYGSVKFLEAKGIDDPVGAVSVHGICGLWGLLSVGLFADGTYGNYSIEAPYTTGLFYGGGGEQLLAQLISVFVVAAWAFGMGYLVFRLMDKVFGIRVSPEEELQGLDIPEHGTPAYPGFLTEPK